MTGPRLLIDTVPMSFTVSEDSKRSGKLVFEGEFSYCGRPTANRRVYSEALLNRELQRLSNSIQERKLYGELDHPEDGKTKFARASHIITGLRIEDGRVIGVAEVLNTTAGKNLRAIIEANGKVGVSSRGFGSTVASESGEEQVQEDFRLLSYDVVVDPANSTSYPEPRFENADPASYVAPRVESRGETMPKEAEFAALAQRVFDEQREKVREEERVKLQSGVSSQVKTEAVSNDLRAKFIEQDLKMKALEAQNTKLMSLAKDTGFRYFLERSIAEDVNAKSIRVIVGDVSRFESKEEIVNAISEARKELAEQIQQAEQVAQVAARNHEMVEQDRTALKNRVAKLEEALSKSAELNNLLSVRLYAEQRISNHPQRKKIRSMIEASDPSTAQEVDKLVESVREQPRDAEDNEAIRSRIRRRLPGGFTPSAEMEERDTGPLSEEKEESPRQRKIVENRADALGIPLDEFNRLAGISSGT